MSALAPTAARAPIAGLYALTPELADTAALVARVAAALAGGAAVVQYRNKLGDAALRREQALALRALCAARGATFIVNDDVDLAREVAADGVHLGRDDAAVAAARQRLGAGAIIGASCYDSLERAQRAVAAGADYLAFGSFFASSVKPEATRAHPSLLTAAKARWRVPVVAIGGISATNAPALIAAGADALAVISALFDAPDVAAAAEALCRVIALRPDAMAAGRRATMSTAAKP
jgi:thiamine-phosphate pyrophosphorylase